MTESPLSGWLACPVCRLNLDPVERRVVCAAGHSFDVARQGYVNLLRRAAPPHADTAAMLEARARFLAAGHYIRIARATTAALRDRRRIVEVGAGTGYYLAHALDHAPDARGLATDVSAAAARRCARAHARAGAIVADTWEGLALRDETADAVLCVFAPRNLAEFARILTPGGVLVVAVPRPEHLARLRSRYRLLAVGANKTTGLSSAPGWEVTATVDVDAHIDLPESAVADLIAMGPNAFHTAPEVRGPARVHVAVTIMSLQRSHTLISGQ